MCSLILSCFPTDSLSNNQKGLKPELCHENHLNLVRKEISNGVENFSTE